MKTDKRVFSPIYEGKGLSPEDYILKYPELAEAEETRNLRGVELMWCWYYSSPESPFVLKEYPAKERCILCTELVFDTIYKGRMYDEKIIEQMRRGIVPSQFGQALDFFRKKNIEVRARAKTMIETMFEKFNDIIEGGADKFKSKDGETDFTKYASTMRLIRGEMKGLIKEVEEGFGVSENHINIGNDEKEGDFWNKTYLKTK